MESRVHQKQQKRVRECLRDLEDEIEIAVNFLKQLRRHSRESVLSLNTIPQNRQYDELSRVHSFLTKYLDAVSNINWKFELMEIEGASDLTFYMNYNRDVELYSKKSDFAMDEKKHEPPQKPFENIINKEQLNFENPPPYTEVVKTPENFQKLIDFSNSSSEGEEVKEINQDVSQTVKLEDLKDIKISKTYVEDITYKGLPLKDEKIQLKNENLVKEREEICKVNEKVTVEEIIEEIRPMEIHRVENIEYKGVVEHIESPGEFYVHFITEEIFLFGTMKEIMQSLNDQITKARYPYNDVEADFMDRKQSAIEILGDYALWFSSFESIWCRAKITDYQWNDNSDLVKIFLFDYGDSKLVPLNQLKPMNNVLRKFPMFAQRCHLAEIYPTGSKSRGKMGIWSDEEIRLFKVLANIEEDESSSDCKIVIGKQDFCNHPESIPVILYMNGNVSVNDEIVNFEYAIRLNPPPAPLYSDHGKQKKSSPKSSSTVPPAENRDQKLSKAMMTFEKNEAIDNWDPIKEDYDSYANNPDLNTDDPAAFIYGYVPKDYERICHHYNRTGRCSKGDACRKEHIRLHPEGITTDKEEVYACAFNRLPPLSIGDAVKVQITYFGNVDLFYCVLAQELKSSDEETLKSLVDFMNEENNVKCMKKLAIPPAEGQIVIARYSENDMWYRARVLSSNPEADEYELFFVDYGNIQIKNLSAIRHIEPKYLHLPFQAIKCQLYNVGPRPDVNKEALKDFSKTFIYKQLRARIMHLNPGENISLIVRLFDENYHDIGKELISKNLAVEDRSLKLSEEMFPG